jgi:hypothetical protein
VPEILDRIRIGEWVDHYETTRRRKEGATIATIAHRFAKETP